MQADYKIRTRSNLTPGFYVVDELYQGTIEEAILDGPFDSYAKASADRAEYNIADDCAVVEVLS